MNFHWEIGPLMLCCWLVRWNSVLYNGIDDMFEDARGKDYWLFTPITALTISISSYPACYTYFYLMYKANIAQGSILACFTNLTPYLQLFLQQPSFSQEFKVPIEDLSYLHLLPLFSSLFLFSYLEVMCCFHFQQVFSVFFLLFCVLSSFIASIISRSNFFPLPLYFPDLL